MVLSVIDRATAPLRQVKESLGGVSGAADKLKGAGQSMVMTGGLMSGAAGQIMGGLESIIAPASDIEEALAKVATVVTPLEGTVVDAMGRIKKAAIDHSLAHRDSAASFIDTTYAMISAGLDEAQAIEATSTAMAVARATMGDAGKAAALVAGLYNNVGDKTRNVGDEMARLGDVVTKTQQTFQFADLNQLNEGLKYGIPQALGFGIAIEDLHTVIGTLNNAQIVGSQAGTSFAATMRSMNKASADMGFQIARNEKGGVDFIGTIRNIEKQFGSLDQMTEEVKEGFAGAFGSEAWAGLSLMIGKSDEMAANLEKVRASAGASAEAQRIMTDTWGGSADIVKNHLIAFKAALATVMPLLGELAKHASAGLAWARGFAEAHPTLVKVGMIGAVITGVLLTIASSVLIAVGGMTMFAGHALAGFAVMGKALVAIKVGFLAGTKAALGFAAGLLALPITWIVLAIIAAVALIYIYWEPIKAFFLGLWESVSAAFVSAWGSLKAAWSAVTGFFSGIVASVRAIFADGWVKGIRRIVEGFNPVVLIGRLLARVVPWLLTQGARLAVAAVELGVRVGTAMVDWLKALPARLATAATALLAWAAMLAVRLTIAIIERVQALPGQLLALGSRILEALAEGVQAAWGALMSFLGSVWTSIVDAVRGGLFQDLFAIFRAISPLAWMADAFDALTQWLFGFSLYDAGANILRTLVSGIKSMAAAPVEAMRGVVQKLRNLLPFSPAKDGPLRDLHRVKLIETVADAVRPAPLVNAMSAAAGLALAALPATVAPIPAGARSASAAAGGGAGMHIGSVTIELKGEYGQSAVEQLEQWLRDPHNVERIGNALASLKRREAGRDYA
jgi:TP901 family phage tail tape measure protein